MAAFELWEIQTGNLMASYASEADALRVVARTAQAHGSTRVLTIALLLADEDGELQQIAAGADLLARAERVGQDATHPPKARSA